MPSRESKNQKKSPSRLRARGNIYHHLSTFHERLEQNSEIFQNVQMPEIWRVTMWPFKSEAANPMQPSLQ